MNERELHQSKQIRENIPLEFLGRGSNRMVFKLNDKQVVKFAFDTTFRKGTEQNRVEKIIWEALEENHTFTDGFSPETVGDRFAPVINVDSEYNWLIMPYAEDVGKGIKPEQKSNAVSNQLYYLNRQSEFHQSDNIGWLNGWYRIIDYGSFIPRKFIQRELPSEYVEKIGENNIA